MRKAAGLFADAAAFWPDLKNVSELHVKADLAIPGEVPVTRAANEKKA
jgi:hypothetical protein